MRNISLSLTLFIHADPLKWKWRQPRISDMNFMTMQRPESFIYSSFKLGNMHLNMQTELSDKAVRQSSDKKVLRDYKLR